MSGNGGAIGPGDTIWLRGGTYTGLWNISVSGALGSGDNNIGGKIIFRNYNCERAILDSGTTSGFVLTVNGSYVWIWGLEITKSQPNPDSLNDKPGVAHGNPVGSKVINCYIHNNTGNGISAFSGWTNAEFYGNVIYYNGRTPNAGPNYAYGVYTQNSTGNGKDYRNNIIWGNWGNYPTHSYTGTPGNLSNIRWYRNVTFKANNSGAGSWNLFGGSGSTTGHVFDSNYVYSYDVTDGVYDLGGHNAYGGAAGSIVTNNYFGRGKVWHARNNSGTTYTGNRHFGEKVDFTNSTCATCSTYDGNIDYSSTPTANWGPFVQPNSYEPGYGFVVVFNWTNASSVNADLSSILSAGDSFKIIDAQNPFGPPIVTGTYGGGMVAIPTTSTAIATPTSVPSGRNTPSHTPQNGIHVWLVRKV